MCEKGDVWLLCLGKVGPGYYVGNVVSGYCVGKVV